MSGATIAGPNRFTASWGRGLGVLLLAHFALVCAVKIALGVAEETLWMSHVGLLIAGLGFVRCSTSLIALSLIDVLVVHSVWLVDWSAWMLVGRFPLGVTSYLEHAGLPVWAATFHHFYLSPVLLVAVLFSRECPRVALAGAVGLFVALSVISRGCLPRSANVNFAFRVAIELNWAFTDWVNTLPGPAYLLVLNAFVSVVFFLPTYLVLRCWCDAGRGHPPRHRPSSAGGA